MRPQRPSECRGIKASLPGQSRRCDPSTSGRSGQNSKNPLPTGSATTTNTIGIVFVSRCSAATTGVVCATIKSGCRLTNSLAKPCMRATSDAAQPASIRILRPSVQPNSRSVFLSVASSITACRSPWALPKSTPIRRVLPRRLGHECQRTNGNRSTEKRDEIASFHWPGSKSKGCAFRNR
jgi:hypothetical protein